MDIKNSKLVVGIVVVQVEFHIPVAIIVNTQIEDVIVLHNLVLNVVEEVIHMRKKDVAIVIDIKK